jgi:hypothetical protein
MTREPRRAAARGQQTDASWRNACSSPGEVEADAAQCLAPVGKTTSAHGPAASAHPHTSDRSARQRAANVRPRPHRSLPPTLGASKHQVTTLLLAKARKGRRALPGHGHALDANPRGNPKSHLVAPSDADPLTGGQPRCRKTPAPYPTCADLCTAMRRRCSNSAWTCLYWPGARTNDP